MRVREGLEGLIHISELSQQRVAHPGDVVHEGQKLKLKVISLEQERHRLGLSLKQAEEAPASGPSAGRQPRRRASVGPRRRPRVRHDPGRPGARGRHRQHACRRVRPGPPADGGDRSGARRHPTGRGRRRIDAAAPAADTAPRQEAAADGRRSRRADAAAEAAAPTSAGGRGTGRPRPQPRHRPRPMLRLHTRPKLPAAEATADQRRLPEALLPRRSRKPKPRSSPRRRGSGRCSSSRDRGGRRCRRGEPPTR